jgi:hypothetical protein
MAPLRLVRSTYRFAPAPVAGPDQRTAPSRPDHVPWSARNRPAECRLPTAPLSVARWYSRSRLQFNSINFSAATLSSLSVQVQWPVTTLHPIALALCCAAVLPGSCAMAAATLLQGPAAASPRLGAAASAPSASHGRRRLTFSFRYARVRALTHLPARSRQRSTRGRPPGARSVACTAALCHQGPGNNGLSAPACSWGVPPAEFTRVTVGVW